MPGGAFRPPTNFSLNIPKKTKSFLFPTALPVHITPTAQGQSPSNAGCFLFRHEFFPSLNIPKKTKSFLFPTALPVHITPTAQGQSPSDAGGLFPTAQGQSPSDAGGLFPTAQGQSPSDAGSFFPFPKCPLATTAARCYGTSQLGQCHPRVTLTAGKGWQAPLDPPTGRQGAVPWDRALPRPRPYPGQGGNQPLHPVP